MSRDGNLRHVYVCGPKFQGCGSNRVLILFVGDGRVGNQVFQYAALSALAPPGARIVAVGLENLDQLFDLKGPPCFVVPGGVWMKRVVKYLLRPLLLRPLSRWLRVISYAHEAQSQGMHPGSDGELKFRAGLLRSIVFVDGGFYQNSEYWPRPFQPGCLELREEWRAAARRKMAEAGNGATARPCFLHVRRGDYLGYTTYGLTDLLLPTEYFLQAIDSLRARAPQRRLFVVTDDPEWAEREFAGIAERVIISSNPCLDFAVMAECGGGIVSNSTFSLAAALFMRDPDCVIAPQYWFGFRVRQWLPPRIRFAHERIEYLPIRARAA